MSQQNQQTSRFWLVAISTAFISYGVLTFEVALTRIFSVMLSYHIALWRCWQ